MVVIGGIAAASLQLAGGFNHDGRQRTGDDQHPVEAADAHVMNVSRGVADDHLKEKIYVSSSFLMLATTTSLTRDVDPDAT